MKTHGGRSFLHGHLFGDNVHEYLAPCIYEGEGEMLGMAFFKSLVKQHGTQYFEPVGKALAAAQNEDVQPRQPAARLEAAEGAGAVRRRGGSARSSRASGAPSWARCPTRSASTPSSRSAACSRMPLEISAAMRKHQLKLADRQCRMSELSSRVQKLVVMLATSLYAAKQNDEVVRTAADVICQDFARELTGKRPTRPLLPGHQRPGRANRRWQVRLASPASRPDEILMKYEA